MAANQAFKTVSLLPDADAAGALAIGVSACAAATRRGSDAPAIILRAATEDARAMAKKGRRQPNFDINPAAARRKEG